MSQNVSNEVLLEWFKFQAKYPRRSGVCAHGEWQKYTNPSPRLSKDEGLRHIGHSISIGNLILGFNSVTVSYLIHWGILLQNATAILLQNATEVNAPGFLLQNTTVITGCDCFISKRNSYYKIQQLLQIETVQKSILSYVFSSSCIWKKMVKIPWRFDKLLLIWSICLLFITYDYDYKDYSKFCTRKCKKQHYVYWDFNETSIIYIKSNMVLLI